MSRSRLPRARLIAVAMIALAIAGCRSKGDIVLDDGVGVTAVRSACPAVGIPDYTGDITMFRPGGNRSAADIDVVASMTNVRSQCDEKGAQVNSTVTFDVLARRLDTRGARQVAIPYFITVLRGGSAVVTKRTASVTLTFADGQERAQARGQGGSSIDRAEASLPQEIREKITRKRRAGDTDAAVDPLSAPEVKAAVARATFELLLGFQLDETQFAYNVTR